MFRMKDFGFFSDSPSSIRGIKKRSYIAWQNMIKRCYDINCAQYKYYGGIGAYICAEWHYFSNFERWFDANYFHGCSIDKDKSGMNFYSPESCVMITKGENTSESNSRMNYQFLKDKTGNKNHMAKPHTYYEEVATTRVHFKEYCKKQGWVFEEFEEIFAYMATFPSGQSTKKYFYKIK